MKESHAPHRVGAAGSANFHTPGLDQTATGGLQLNAAYCASPPCFPVRAAITTGRFPQSPLFAECHGTGTASTGFVARLGSLKLIHGLGQSPQFCDRAHSADDKIEPPNALAHGADMARLMATLRAIANPDAVGHAAQDAQRRLIDRVAERTPMLARMGGLAHIPPPGVSWRDL